MSYVQLYEERRRDFPQYSEGIIMRRNFNAPNHKGNST